MIGEALKSGFARPKTAVMYSFGYNTPFEPVCYITVHPQQTWKFSDNGPYVKLRRDQLHTTMIISKEAFEKAWIIKEEN